LIQSIILYNFSVNRTMLNISDIRIKNTEQNNISSDIKENEISDIGERLFLNNSRSYAIERDMIKKVMNGDVEGLIDGATKIPSVSSGNLAPHLLRHNKNFFIKLETIMARAAIETGLDVDEIFSIEEMYIRKCESLDNIDRIKNLQYHMIIDYADRVKKLRQYNGQNSKLVNEISRYIRNHISEPIKTSDIADYLGKSRGGITTEFKKQTGMNLSDFIKLKKIQEAQELLYETKKSLVLISDYLGFSSQSHFTRVFKEITGITPKEYRDKNHISK
ncbi:MAG: helix-turn-helix domain-containing protein, partial [Ruminococcus sp.]|nr:helix-turn-helix domain-containing protein [Ruminococcus sp.]